MLTVDLTSLSFFSKKQAILLNDLVAVNKQLMPHVVAGATGCRLEEAMALLIFLFDKNLANGFVLIYHSKHQDFYFMRHPLKDGLPKVDKIFCQVCEENIEDESELLYDFEFVINKDVGFKV
jgi:hypothetical protein